MTNDDKYDFRPNLAGQMGLLLVDEKIDTEHPTVLAVYEPTGVYTMGVRPIPLRQFERLVARGQQYEQTQECKDRRAVYKWPQQRIGDEGTGG